MSAQVDAILAEWDYAIRFKSSDGGAMIVGKDRQPWSLTQKYFKSIAPDLVENYTDWVPMEPEKHAAYFALLLAVQRGEPVVKIHGRTVTVMSPILDALDPPTKAECGESVSPVSEAALKSAGQVAEALGIAIRSYIDKDRPMADAAHKELIWVAKNVGWQTKENRHLFRSKWAPNEEVPPTTDRPGEGEPPSDGGPPAE